MAGYWMVGWMVGESGNKANSTQRGLSLSLVISPYISKTDLKIHFLPHQLLADIILQIYKLVGKCCHICTYDPIILWNILYTTGYPIYFVASLNYHPSSLELVFENYSQPTAVSLISLISRQEMLLVIVLNLFPNLQFLRLKNFPINFHSPAYSP